MHPIAVDGSSALRAFLSHHQPPSPTRRHRHTLLPSSPRPVTKEQLSVSHGDGMQLLCSSSDDRETLSPRCRYDRCTDTLTTSGNHLVSFQFRWQNTHSAPCVRPTHLGVERDPTIKMRCRRSLLSSQLLELLGATSQPGVSEHNLKKSVCSCNDFDVVLISLLIWRAPPNV